MKTALVLEGGGMRGIYTAGVLDVFMEYDISVDAVIGVSAGAIHGASYVAGQKGRNIRYYKNYRSDRHFMSFYSLFTTGNIVGTDFCYREIPDVLDPFDYEAFKKSKIDFYAVCTDIQKGKPVYVLIDDAKAQMDYIRASASLPMVSQPVKAGGRLLLDGGVTDSIPVRAAQKLGYDKIITVLTRPLGYVKKPEGSLLCDMIYRNYPALVHAVRVRHDMYNGEIKYISELEKAHGTFVLRPSRFVDISRMEKNIYKIDEMYDLGVYDAKANIRSILNYLA